MTRSAEQEWARAVLANIAQRSGDYAEVSVPSGLRHGLIAAELRCARVWFQIWARHGQVVLGVKRDDRLQRAATEPARMTGASRSDA